MIMNASRKLPVAEYLKVLQLEYLSYKLRELIYEEFEFIKINREIALKKKEKIQNLAKKISALSIFDSQEFFNSFLSREFLQEFGLPKIQYGIDEKRNQAVSYWDKFYVLKPGVSVEYKGEICKVCSNDPVMEVITLCKDKEELYIPYTYVKLKDLRSLLSATFKE